MSNWYHGFLSRFFRNKTFFQKSEFCQFCPQLPFILHGPRLSRRFAKKGSQEGCHPPRPAWRAVQTLSQSLGQRRLPPSLSAELASMAFVATTAAPN
eukprot:g40266.t1